MVYCSHDLRLKNEVERTKLNCKYDLSKKTTGENFTFSGTREEKEKTTWIELDPKTESLWRIKAIETEAFQHLTNLVGIIIHYNKIKSLSSKILGYNKIKMIDPETFKNLKNLKLFALHRERVANYSIVMKITKL